MIMICWIILGLLFGAGLYQILKWLGIILLIVVDWLEDFFTRPSQMKRVIHYYRQQYSGRCWFDNLPEHLWDGWWKTIRRWRPWRRR